MDFKTNKRYDSPKEGIICIRVIHLKLHVIDFHNALNFNNRVNYYL